MPRSPERTGASPELTRLRTISWLFDDLIRIPGTRMRVGIDALLGLLPGGGDIIGGAVSAYAILGAAKLGAPPAVIMRMALNIVVDTLVGVIPLLGDLFDAGWKANRRNVALLERYAAAPSAVSRSSLGLVAVVILGLVVFIVGVAAGSVWLLSRIF